MRELMKFSVNGRFFAVELRTVKAIHRQADLIEHHPSPEKNPGHRRMVNLPEGYAAFIFDLRKLFQGLPEAIQNGETTQAQPTDKMIITEHSGYVLALQVDHVEGVVQTDEPGIEPLPPVFRGKSLQWFPKILHIGQELILLFNPEELVKQVQHEEEFEKKVGWLQSLFSEAIHEETLEEMMSRSVQTRLREVMESEFRSLARKITPPKPRVKKG
jgi:chemotaxis signal transduction protein